jgi:hypothetical protein
VTGTLDVKPEKDPLEKALKKAEAERGLLLPADRYKALVNAVKAAQDLIELGDRKARFALVIMSVLNAVAVLMVVRGGDSLLPRTGVLAKVLVAELAAYAVATVYYLSQAIAALRPRGVKPPPMRELPSVVEPGISMRVLFYADVIARDRATYRDLWDGLRTDNLTTELADQLYALSQINRVKYSALDRLYFGLTVMTVMLAIVIGTVGLSHALA